MHPGDIETRRNPRRRSNKAQERPDSLLTRVLVTKAYGELALEHRLEHRYATARYLHEAIELDGAELSDEAIALKIKAAAEVLPFV